MDRSSTEHYVEELYFLIAKFLETGPCKQSLQKLKEEIAEHKIIPKRLDWEGNQHEQTFDELENKYPHIAPQHLLDICKRIGPIVDKEIPPCVAGIKTLLGAGSQSLLRNKDTIKKHLRLSEFIVRRHCRSILSPVTCHNHNIVQVLYGQEISGPACRRHIFSPKLYNRTHLLNRNLGHLTAVYCLLFDQTGKFVITGADDLLVKVWSAVDGRLLCTLRGASSEITDIAINIENTLLAAGSLDKVIRVWCLQTAYPVATLSAHTGMITGVNFCPNAFNGNHYLVSTSTDGSVAFWCYTLEPVKFQARPILYNEKIRPGQAQMICSSFSYGGAFLATGSADHNVRVYSMSANPPHRILEMEKHSDRVDSLLWGNRSPKFISGSKDGSAVIWQYRAQAWHTKFLDMSTVLPGSAQREEDSKVKLKVTMVCWSCDDSFAITAVNNFVIKIWTSTGKLLRELTSHREVVYCLEHHPLDPSILMSAGHDGIVFIWDLRTGEQLFQHQNYIEGQGNGAIFDAKWSPDGTMMAATDSHGHLLFFGIADYNDKMESLPKELFFHTDYRPLVRDSANQVLDEQTQTPPHLMPPPFLVDVDGNPYPPHQQKLVPGRENCTVDQLIPNIIYTPGGQPEVVQFVSEARSNIDQRIEELAQQGLPTDSTSSRNESSPRSRFIRRGEIEGRRQSARSDELEGFSWRNRILINPLPRGTLETIYARIKLFGELELEEFERERTREIEYIAEMPMTSSKKPKRKLVHNYRTRATRDAQAAQPAEEEEGSEVITEGNSSDVTGLSEESSSESSSTEYSDWVADHSVNLEPPQRSRRQRKRKPPPRPPSACSLDLQDSQPSTSSHRPPPLPRPSTTSASTKKPPLPPPEDIKEIPELYRPSEWLSEVIPKKFPYYPQMGDEVMFFAQGYELYLKAVSDRKVYELAKSQLRPWGNLELQEPELVKVIGIKYELRPPRLCCLRVAVMKENGSLTGERFTIKYHDVPDVIDFFVLKQTYDTAMMRNWKIGDRFRSMIDDGWWWGVIEGRRPQSDSSFLCHRIRWDNGETEDMSPWDMEPIDPSREPEKGGSVPVLAEEIAGILYHPRADEWPGGDRESYCRRTLSGLEEVMGLSIAEPFTAPVDINVYKSYAFIVEFPIDVSTIKARLENRFYRRLTAAQYDIRCLATNAEKFNEPHSIIVKNARIITDLCLKICKETEFLDVPSVYRELLDTYESTESEEEGAGRDRAAANRSLRAMRRANHLEPDWRRDCRQLLEVLWTCNDSQPFRGPVDRIEHPEYHKVVTTPVDLGQIREELKGNNYSSPIEFCKDIRLIFSNSRQYNTNKRSKIYVMTVRLAAMAEEHMKRIIKDWKSANRKQNKNKLNGLRKRIPRKGKSVDDSGGSVEEEISESSADEQPTHSRLQSTIRPKRIKVLLPKVAENNTPTNSFYNNKSIEGKYQTRSTNGITKPSTRHDFPNEDNTDQIRPPRLKVPIMKKLQHFVSTSETDSSSQPSTSSSGHRNLRVTKAVSYAENCEEESSQSSTEGKPKTRIQAYNMRSSGSSQMSFPSSSRVNYNENSSSESDKGSPLQKDESETGSYDKNNVTSSPRITVRIENNSESDDGDLEPVEASSIKEIEIHFNGTDTISSSGTSSNRRFILGKKEKSLQRSSSNDTETGTDVRNKEEFSSGQEDDIEESEEEWGKTRGRQQSKRASATRQHSQARRVRDKDGDYDVGEDEEGSEDSRSPKRAIRTTRSLRRGNSVKRYATRKMYGGSEVDEESGSEEDEETSEEESNRPQRTVSKRKFVGANSHKHYYKPQEQDRDYDEEEVSRLESRRPQRGVHNAASVSLKSSKSSKMWQEDDDGEDSIDEPRRPQRAVISAASVATNSSRSSHKWQEDEDDDGEESRDKPSKPQRAARKVTSVSSNSSKSSQMWQKDDDGEESRDKPSKPQRAARKVTSVASNSSKSSQMWQEDDDGEESRDVPRRPQRAVRSAATNSSKNSQMWQEDDDDEEDSRDEPRKPRRAVRSATSVAANSSKSSQMWQEDEDDDEEDSGDEPRRAVRSAASVAANSNKSSQMWQEDEDEDGEESRDEPRKPQRSVRSAKSVAANSSKIYQKWQEDDENEESPKVSRRPQSGIQKRSVGGNSSNSHLTERKDFLSDSEERIKNQSRRPERNKNKSNVRYSRESYQSEDDSNSEESEGPGKGGGKRSVGRYSSLERRRGSDGKGPRKRKVSSDSSESYQGATRKSGRVRRPLKRQHYTYESDSEMDQLDSQGSSPSSGSEDDKPKISISSRGRVRKITPRARAYLLD